MKKVLFLSLLLLSASAMWAQTPVQPTINVSGKAEMEIEPDEIYLLILLDETVGNKKVGIQQKENELKGVVNDLKIPIGNLTVQNAEGTLDESFWKKDELKTQKAYQLKLGDAKTLNAFLLACRDKDLKNVRISRIEHSRRQEFLKEMRIKAIKAAKEKAEYLCEAIGQKVGKALSINENMQPEYGFLNTNVRIRGTISLESDVQLPELEFKKITISAEISASFEIL